MLRKTLFICVLAVFSGCASLQDAPLTTDPAFQQPVRLRIYDDYQMYQAPRTGHDIGDLQSFHSQHTLPILIEDAFREIFPRTEVFDGEPDIESGAPDVPAVFEVRLADLAHDIYNEADSYRSQVVLAVAMKSPRGTIFWQKAFRGEGYVQVDPQFSTGLGPQDAVIDAMDDAIQQMQQALVHAPEVRQQLKYYKQIDEARKGREVSV